jgi:hypothetical protein
VWKLVKCGDTKFPFLPSIQFTVTIAAAFRNELLSSVDINAYRLFQLNDGDAESRRRTQTNQGSPEYEAVTGNATETCNRN